MKIPYGNLALFVAVAAVVWTVTVYGTRKYITKELPQ